MSREESERFFDPSILDRDLALARYRAVRQQTLRLADPLSPEDMAIQSMIEASPTKWHLAHTTWFFETFILRQQLADFRPFDEAYAFLFNSYYEAEGPRQPRPERGMLSRPSLADVMGYRDSVDLAMASLIEQQAGDDSWPETARLLDLGCQHEEQHQELLLTDIKHALYQNPLRPAYTNATPSAVTEAPELRWLTFEEGVHEIGHDGQGFGFDCEGPRHKVYVQPFELASRTITNGEYLEFVRDGGYQRPEFWLSDGWAVVQDDNWTSPLYWECHDGDWQVYTMSGMRGLDMGEPVCHLSYFEADAFASWADSSGLYGGARLPREAELEIAETSAGPDADDEIGEINDAHAGKYHPLCIDANSGTGSDAEPRPEGLSQLFGNLWEWTQSAYSPHPGFRAAKGAVGEYNGKFMSGQFVLKGGSCATPRGHIRSTYRNFFYPQGRWQFTGLRLARDI